MAERSQAVPTTKMPHFATLTVMALDPEAVGARIRQAREAKGWNHAEFAERVGEALDPPKRANLRTVQRWQKGRDPKTSKSWLPRLKTLMVIAEVLEVPSSYFVEAAQPEDGDPWHLMLDRLDAVERTQEGNTEMLAELLRIARDDPPPAKADASGGT
jgi:transcriptional regulator with XRE-family HTH domain